MVLGVNTSRMFLLIVALFETVSHYFSSALIEALRGQSPQPRVFLIELKIGEHAPCMRPVSDSKGPTRMHDICGD